MNVQDPPAPARAKVRRGALVFAAWTALGLYMFSQDASRYWYWKTPAPLWSPLLLWLFAVWLLAALTPLILRLGVRFPLGQRGRRVRHVAVHGLASIVVAVVHVAVSSALISPLGALQPLVAPGFVATFGLMLVMSLHGNILSYWTVLAVQYGLRALRLAQEREKAALRLEARAAALEAQLSAARLSALKAQLQPHFLFNTLNAIMVLVRQRQLELAEETLARFADLLRLVLDDGDASEVSLRRELDYVQRYLAIEQLRFADRLRIEQEVEPGLLGMAVPSLALQPLVENAVRHGIARKAAAGLVRVCARRQGAALQLEVQDDGPGPGDEASGGIGLANTRARLRQLYGDAAGLSLQVAPGGGALVIMTLPLRAVAELPS